jgi:undecaprenyl-diphosphatase
MRDPKRASAVARLAILAFARPRSREDRMLRRILLPCCLLITLTLATPRAQAGGGLLGLDHAVSLDDHGIWARRNQQVLLTAMLAGEAGVALYEGGDTRLGRTMWQSIDATVVGGVAAELLKRTFARSRPNQSSDPDLWFQGSGHDSFPSGEATITSAVVTPVMLEYGAEHPAVYALALLPAYDAIARVKVHGHWQSDVLAGLALGTATGYFAHARLRTPLVLGILPGGFYVGFKKSFGGH